MRLSWRAASGAGARFLEDVAGPGFLEDVAGCRYTGNSYSTEIVAFAKGRQEVTHRRQGVNTIGVGQCVRLPCKTNRALKQGPSCGGIEFITGTCGLLVAVLSSGGLGLTRDIAGHVGGGSTFMIFFPPGKAVNNT